MEKIFLFGIDRAGKTVITNYLVSGIADKTFNPTLAPNSKLLVLKELESRIWDMPGQKKFREIWTRHVLGSKVFLHVVDVADKERFQEAYDSLKNFIDRISDKVSSTTPFIEVFHKMDLDEAKANIEDAKKKFKVEDIFPGEVSYIETTIKDTNTLENLKNILSEKLTVQ